MDIFRAWWLFVISRVSYCAMCQFMRAKIISTWNLWQWCRYQETLLRRRKCQNSPPLSKNEACKDFVLPATSSSQIIISSVRGCRLFIYTLFPPSSLHLSWNCHIKIKFFFLAQIRMLLNEPRRKNCKSVMKAPAKNNNNKIYFMISRHCLVLFLAFLAFWNSK